MEAQPVANRLELFTSQYTVSYDTLYKRLAGLTDPEYFWEPVKNCWNLRRAGEASPKAQGKGDWRLIQYNTGPDKPPFTTIAWRLCHLVSWQMIRRDYTFGSKSLTWDAIEFPGTANDALVFLQNSHQAWLTGLNGLNEADLDVVGLSSNPWGYDPKLPFGEVMWWTNRELIHHAAEICLLRDLYSHQ